MEDFTLFYNRHKSLVLASLFLLGSFFILLQVTIPQIGAVIEAQSVLQAEQDKLLSYKTSVATIGQIPESQVENDFVTTTNALPSTKSVQSMYLALTASASNAQVSINGFTVKVGGVFKKGVPESVAATGVPYVTVNLSLAGLDRNGVQAFAKELLNEAPLSKIVKIRMNQGLADVDVVFYYKPFDLNLLQSDIVVPFTASENKLIQELPQPEG
ncbi:MAG TPA: hypothetical protein PKA38_04590 [Candidatus Levybacteria bacterium]|nr:hypothetical protein [Candidatus Levybacteria bacterium]